MLCCPPDLVAPVDYYRIMSVEWAPRPMSGSVNVPYTARTKEKKSSVLVETAYRLYTSVSLFHVVTGSRFRDPNTTLT